MLTAGYAIFCFVQGRGEVTVPLFVMGFQAGLLCIPFSATWESAKVRPLLFNICFALLFLSLQFFFSAQSRHACVRVPPVQSIPELWGQQISGPSWLELVVGQFLD